MEADEKFLKLFHNNLLGMICTDEDHRVTDINDHLLDLIGLERHEAIGKTGLELNLLDPAYIQSMWQEMADTGRISNLEIPFVTPAGVQKTLLLSTEKILIKGRP
ncbi:MAG TPA: PAS domain-containing protein, partial [Ferruginibacter sp.]|nr:PAS domain-containing protein [Ferruginibacter sp.]